MSFFNAALEKTLGHEGPLVDDPDDLGGKTNWGISQRQYPKLDIENLTRSDAANIYYHDYWLKFRCYEIVNESIAVKYFDLIVNMRPQSAAKVLQYALASAGERVKWDFVVGSKTLAAINRVDSVALLAAMKSEQAWHYRLRMLKNPVNEKYKGWISRAYS